MLFDILIVLGVVLLFVLFYKRPVNTAGAGWHPTVPLDPPATKPPVPSSELASAEPPSVPPATAKTPDTFDFNDIFSSRGPGPSDQPRA